MNRPDEPAPAVGSAPADLGADLRQTTSPTPEGADGLLGIWESHNLDAPMWCRCGWHRVDKAHPICPICADKLTKGTPCAGH